MGGELFTPPRGGFISDAIAAFASQKLAGVETH